MNSHDSTSTGGKEALSTSEFALSTINSLNAENAPILTSGSSQRSELDTMTIVLTCVGLLGTLGNLFVVVVIFHSSKMRSNGTNLLIIVQSCTDLFCSLFIILTSLVTVKADDLPSGLAGDILCRVWQVRALLWGCMTMSSYSLVFIGLERYVAIVFPFKHNKRIVRKYIFLIVFLEFLLGFIPQFLLVMPFANFIDGVCILVAFPYEWLRYFVPAMVLLWQFFLPLLFILYLYGHMAFKLGKYKKASSLQSGVTSADKVRDANLDQAQTNLLQMCVIISISYIVCWSPNILYAGIYLVSTTPHKCITK